MTWIKNQLLKNLHNILKTLILPFVVVVLFWALGFPMVKGFIVTFFLQFIIFYFLNTKTESKIVTELEKENMKAIEMANTNYVLVDCQRCKGQNNIKVSIAEDNQFECTHCGAKNKILLNLDVALVTEIPNNAE